MECQCLELKPLTLSQKEFYGLALLPHIHVFAFYSFFAYLLPDFLSKDLLISVDIHVLSFVNILQDALISLLPKVADLVGDRDIPVIAAGGIVDARGYVAALALGAQGVCLGTRFHTLHLYIVQLMKNILNYHSLRTFFYHLSNLSFIFIDFG